MPDRSLRTRVSAASFVACAVLVAGVVAPAQGQEDPRAQQTQVQNQQAAVASQINVLEASAADVQAGLASLQAQVAAAEAALTEAQAAVDAAAAALVAARANQALAQRQVDERKRRLKDLAVDSYVNSDTRTLAKTVALDASVDDDMGLLRESLAGFRADQEELALQRLRVAEAALSEATRAAEAAATAAEAKKVDAQSRANQVAAVRDQQASYAYAIEARLDDKLAEAAALRAIDRRLGDQIAAEEQALAQQVAPPGPKVKPPPPPGYDKVPPPPPPSTPDLVTTHGITVARSIGDNLGAMIDAAAADGIKLTGSGYRDYQSQVELRRLHCGPTTYDIYYRPPSECTPPTARPGTSRHEQGLAVDFAANGAAITSHTDPGWLWLNAHGKTYGFYNLDSEPWHWSVDGT
jgi:hypothetical protein